MCVSTITFDFSVLFIDLFNLDISAPVRPQFKLIPVSRSPPTTAAAESGGAKHLNQSQKPTLSFLSVLPFDRWDWITVIANEIRALPGAQQRGHVYRFSLFSRLSPESNPKHRLFCFQLNCWHRFFFGRRWLSTSVGFESSRFWGQTSAGAVTRFPPCALKQSK